MFFDVEGLSYAYGHGGAVFEDVSFSLEQGDILTILGANGSGKSTMLNCLSGIFRARTGTVRIGGEDLYAMGVREVARRLSYVQQVHAASYGFKVDDYLLMGRSPYVRFGGAPTQQDYDAVADVLAELDIEYLAEKSFNEISGGERQQVQIARALVQAPQLIMLDEPTNHLDYGNQLKVLQLLKRLAAKGYAIILTTHVPDHAILLEGRVGVLDRTHRFTVGGADELVTCDTLRGIYNVDIDVFYSERLGRRVCAYERIEGDRARDGGATEGGATEGETGGDHGR